MVAVRQSGGPGGRTSYRMTWDGSRVRGQVTGDVQHAAESLARDLEAYLHATLHKVTGRMAAEAFARVEVRGDRIVVLAGSEAPYTVYHEFRYHPQLRQAMDTWAPRISAYLRAAVRVA